MRQNGEGLGVLEMETEEGRGNGNKRGSGGDCGGGIGEQDRGKVNGEWDSSKGGRSDYDC